MKKIFFNFLFCSMMALAVNLSAHQGGLLDFQGLTQIECSIEPMLEKAHRHHHNQDTPGLEPGYSPLAEHQGKSVPHIPSEVVESSSLNWSGYAALTSLQKPATGSVTAVSGSCP